jgi:hypothetical protein
MISNPLPDANSSWNYERITRPAIITSLTTSEEGCSGSRICVPNFLISRQQCLLPILVRSVRVDAFIMSDSRIETELERLYWIHVEFFPMHHESHEQQFSQIADDLCNIISHGQAGKTYRSCTVSLNRLTVDNRQIDVKWLNVPLYGR